MEQLFRVSQPNISLPVPLIVPTLVLVLGCKLMIGMARQQKSVVPASMSLSPNL